MTKLDAERYPKVASLLDIKGFATLLLFVNGTSQAYTGGFSAEEIVIWARKKIGVPVIRISTMTQAEAFLKKHQMFVIGLFEKFEPLWFSIYALKPQNTAATSDFCFMKHTQHILVRSSIKAMKYLLPFKATLNWCNNSKIK